MAEVASPNGSAALHAILDCGIVLVFILLCFASAAHVVKIKAQSMGPAVVCFDGANAYVRLFAFFFITDFFFGGDC
jgi:hypothetical protein